MQGPPASLESGWGGNTELHRPLGSGTPQPSLPFESTEAVGLQLSKTIQDGHLANEHIVSMVIFNKYPAPM